MEHSFNVDVAKEYGVHSAILLNNIAFWCLKNKANDTNLYDGHYWTYNSKKAFSELFPYMTARQIDYALKRLIDEGVLITGNYNANAYDRTLWYAITEKGFSILQNCAMDNTKLCNGNAENVQPIPYKKPDGKLSDNKPIKRTSFDDLIEGYTGNNELRRALQDYIQMRKAIKKPITSRALELAFKELNKLARTDAEKIAIVNQSIMNSWQGLFPLKNNQGTQRKNDGWDGYYKPVENDTEESGDFLEMVFGKEAK